VRRRPRPYVVLHVRVRRLADLILTAGSPVPGLVGKDGDYDAIRGSLPVHPRLHKADPRDRKRRTSRVSSRKPDFGHGCIACLRFLGKRQLSALIKPEPRDTPESCPAHPRGR
jgi:hypothetical protein